MNNKKRKKRKTSKPSLTFGKVFYADYIPEEAQGFVYLITNLINGRKYIGKKSFWQKRRVKQKGKKNRKLVIKESNWRYYYSSSIELKKEIESIGFDKFEFEILFICKSKSETTYTEAKEQFKRDVLYARTKNGEYEYYNSNIMNRFFRGKS